VLTRELTNDTTLTWAAVPRAVRYEVVRRLNAQGHRSVAAFPTPVR
jgi:hypothetical protein